MNSPTVLSAGYIATVQADLEGIRWLDRGMPGKDVHYQMHITATTGKDSHAVWDVYSCDKSALDAIT